MTKQEVRTAILEFFTGHGYD
ncbi:MAG: hypothetical protein JWP44_4546, partial [Mucilaginibacter sp.]|nr:hypothetical protein [Mucilaginibacter sp.]